MKINISEIMPIIRGGNYTEVPRLQFGPRCNYATQFFYLVKGRVNAEINGIKYDLNSGDFILYGPYDIHCLTSVGTEQVVFSTINFSWNRDVAVNIQVGNQHVPGLDEDYYLKSDKKVLVAGLPSIPFILHIPETLQSMLETLLSEIGCNFRNSDEVEKLRFTGLLMEVFHLIIAINNESEKLRPMTWVQQFTSYLNENFANQTLNRKEAGKDLGISESYLTALLRKHLRTNFTDSLTSIRMTKAVEMLNYSDMSIKEVANSAGFANYSYFVFRFHQIYKQTPGKFRSNISFQGK